MDINTKKNIVFCLYVLFNVLLTSTLLLLEYGYLFVSFFVVGGHLRDVCSILYQLANFSKVLSSPREVDTGKKSANVICCLVPVFNEDVGLVENNLCYLTTQQMSPPTKIVVIMIFDGVTDDNRPLFNCGKSR